MIYRGGGVRQTTYSSTGGRNAPEVSLVTPKQSTDKNYVGSSIVSHAAEEEVIVPSLKNIGREFMGGNCLHVSYTDFDDSSIS